MDCWKVDIVWHGGGEWMFEATQAHTPEFREPEEEEEEAHAQAQKPGALADGKVQQALVGGDSPREQRDSIKPLRERVAICRHSRGVARGRAGWADKAARAHRDIAALLMSERPVVRSWWMTGEWSSQQEFW